MTVGEENNCIYTIRFDPEDKYLAAGCSDGTLRVYNLFSGNISYFMTNNRYVKNPLIPEEE